MLLIAPTQGVLGSTVPNGSLVITAHYDSFSIAPGLSVRGGSGAAALLYVARALADLEARGAPARYVLLLSPFLLGFCVCVGWWPCLL